MTTDEIRQLYNFILMKEISGSHTPTEMELAINRAQYELFDDYLPDNGKDRDVRGLPYAGNKRVADALNPFRVTRVVELGENGNGDITKGNDDFVYFDAANFRFFKTKEDCEPDEDPNVPIYVPVDIVTENEKANRLRSTIDFPTKEYPIAVWSSSTTMQFYPTNLNYVECVYFRQPKSFYWGRTTSNGRYAYDSSDPNDQTLEWFPLDQFRVISRSLVYAGINLRSDRVVQYMELLKNQGI